MLSSLMKLRALQWAPLDALLPTPVSTPYGVVRTVGARRLLRFRSPTLSDAGAVAAPSRRGGDSSIELRAADRAPILLIPSLINRWTVFDLLPERSIVGALVGAGHDVFLLDWGCAQDEDRHLSWDDCAALVLRMQRLVARVTATPQSILMGYSSAGTLATICAALAPEQTRALVNIAGPIDFSRAGGMAHFADARWFDSGSIAAAGNVDPALLLSGFLALRPSQLLSDAAVLWSARHNNATVDERVGAAITRWAYDGVPFAARAYSDYISGLYQRNELYNGSHVVGGTRVQLERVTCPILSIIAQRDVIAPAPACLALEHRVSSRDTTRLEADGGHVSALVNAHAANVVYPGLLRWCARVSQ
jgi:polyhydroxyalkanoate synthase